MRKEVMLQLQQLKKNLETITKIPFQSELKVDKLLAKCQNVQNQLDQETAIQKIHKNLIYAASYVPQISKSVENIIESNKMMSSRQKIKRTQIQFDLKSNNNLLQDQIFSLTKQIEILQQAPNKEIIQLRKRLYEMQAKEQQMTQLQKQNIQLNEVINRLQEDRQTNEMKFDHQLQQLKSESSAHEKQLQQKISSLEKDIAQHIRQSTLEIEQLNEQNTNIRKNFQDEQQTMTDLIQKFRDQSITLSAQIDQYKAAFVQQEAKIEQLTYKNNNYKEKHHHEIEALNEKLRGFTQQSKQLASSDAIQRNDAIKTDSMHQVLTNQVDIVTQENTDLRLKNKMLEEQLNIKQKALIQAQKLRNTLEQENDLNQKLREKAVNEVNNLKQDSEQIIIANLNKVIKDQQDLITKLKEKQNTQTQEIQKVQTQKINLTQKIPHTDEEYVQVRKERDKFKALSQTLKDKIVEIELQAMTSALIEQENQDIRQRRIKLLAPMQKMK
ncbi:Hypothetical_protein [Hexamita inflata]|uniref:Hypothetical_protein n=1 Tax=Hexamita inflata TaxID=28002 RepID=A0AA86NRY2_9EUKA|nr:Hypothetical protein HINF_LOCUS12139 [Hexamita inflata]